MEPHDRRIIRSFRTYEEVQEHVFVEQDGEASDAARQELALLQPRLIDLKNFSDFFATQLWSNSRYKCVLGIAWSPIYSEKFNSTIN